MASCPSCRAKVDAEFYSHCPDCGAPLQGEASPVEASAPLSDGTLPPPPPPPPTPARSGCSTALAVAVVGVIGLGLVGGLINLSTSVKRDEWGLIIRSDTISVDDLKVGDCADYTTSRVEFKAVPCDETHDFEVFFSPPYPADKLADYPGEDRFFEWGADICIEQFEPYAGISYELSPDLNIGVSWPSESGWYGSQRTVHCMLIGYDPDDLDNIPKLTGSKRVGP